MADRIYISKLIGDGGPTLQTAFRPAWFDVIGETIPSNGAIDSEKTMAWIGTIDTTTPQHDLLVADNRIRYVPEGLFNTQWSALTQNQKDAVLEVLTYLGLRTGIATDKKVLDILTLINGRILFDPILGAVEADI